MFNLYGSKALNAFSIEKKNVVNAISLNQRSLNNIGKLCARKFEIMKILIVIIGLVNPNKFHQYLLNSLKFTLKEMLYFGIIIS